MGRNEQIDPLLMKFQKQTGAIIYGWSVASDNPADNETCIGNFQDECFVLSEGMRFQEHSDEAARYSVEIALWAYKHVRQKKFYWLDKESFMKRIYRTVNIAMWQKQRESGYEAGFSSSLVTLIIGQKNMWLGSVGNSHAFYIQGDGSYRQTSEDVDEKGKVNKLLGLKRYGLLPQYMAHLFKVGDTVILVSSGVMKVLTSEEIVGISRTSSYTNDGMKAIASAIVDQAKSRGSMFHTGACVVRHIAETGYPSSALLVNE